MNQHFVLINNVLTEVSRDQYREHLRKHNSGVSVAQPQLPLGMGDYSRASAVAVKPAAEVVKEGRK